MAKIGRNAPCPCGTGKKYKKCCQAADAAAARRERAEAAARAVPQRPEASGFAPFGDPEFPPDPWEVLREYPQKALPADTRATLKQMLEIADYQAKKVEIDSADDELEAYRDEYNRLVDDPGKLIERARALFAEPPFEALRFTIPDLERAFESVGYPPSPGTGEFIAFFRRVIEFLVDNARRDALARRLICLMPDYVAEKRHLDACIIRHNFVLVCEPPKSGLCPFLLCMLVYPLDEWRRARNEEEHEPFSQLGLDRETIFQHGHQGIEALLDNVDTQQDGERVMTRFLASHPQLAEQMQTRCHEAEDAAVELLRRDEGQSLLLEDAELGPWLVPLSRLVAAHPEIAEASQTGREPGPQARSAFAKAMVDFSYEVASGVFTRERLQRLRSETNALRRRFEQEGRDESLALSGIYIAASAKAPSGENYLLSRICQASIMRTWQNLCGAADTED